MANEKRLIDANAAAKSIRNAGEIFRSESTCDYDKGWVDALNSVEDLIARMPTVDAVDALEYETIVGKLESLLCHATGNQYSKAGYSLESMCRMVTDYIEECCEEAVKDAAAHGQWLEFNTFMTCSECDTDWFYGDNDCDRFKCCPNCGAKMDGDGNG